MTTSPTASDWELAERYLDRHPTRWGSLSWVAARPLISSLNHLLASHAGPLVNDLRQGYLAAAPDPWLTIDAAQVNSFVVIGDTGEADASQYVVAPALSRVVREHQAGFVVIMSDVIYPSGDVNDYVDAVYSPYRSTDSDQFRVDAPLLGQPGNHDWYDGLYGFMYHFCGRDAKPGPEVYAPTTGSFVQRLARILWRRPSTANARTRASRAPGPAAPLTQPGPYYAVRARDVRVVCIDTGIAGTVDPVQMAWLEQVSADPGPKVLVTGSPLLVNANLAECKVDPPDPQRAPSVWEIVNNPAHHYVATVGGDVHNFQRYPGTGVPGTPQVHLVAGGGGAFLHALHPMELGATDPRIDPGVPHPRPDLTFPTTHESFAFFARELVPSVWRILRMLGLFVLGTGVATGMSVLAEQVAAVRPYAGLLGWSAAAALLGLVVIRLTLRRTPRSDASKRAIVAAAAFLLGILAAVLASGLDPARTTAYVLLWWLATAWHVLFGWAISRSGWWLPRADHPVERDLGAPAFFLGAGALCGVAFGLQLLFFRGTGQILLAAGATLLLFGLAVAGWFLRRNGGARWRRYGGPLAVAAQIVYFGTVVLQLAISESLVPRYVGGLLGVLVLIGLVLATGALLVGITELGALPARLSGGNVKRAWSRAAGVTHQLPLVLLGGVIGVWCLLADGDLARAAIGLSIAVTVPVSLLFFTDLMRRVLGRAYSSVVLAVIVVAAAGAYAWSGWPVRVGLAGALIVLAVVVSVVLAHLVFLGGHTLVFDGPAHRGRIEFTEAELVEIFAAKTAVPRPRVPQVPRQVRRYAQLTYPGVGEPGGPLQREVAEIYSRDIPPFHKGFLHLVTDGQRMRIVLHTVYGHQPSQALLVADVALR